MESIKFAGHEHESFYYEMLEKAGQSDVYHKAFFYTVGISPDARHNIGSLFNFGERCIETDALRASWQTGGTVRLCRLAFNLWNGWAEPGRENLSSPYELFDCGFAPYFFEAIRLRYPEYCRKL